MYAGRAVRASKWPRGIRGTGTGHSAWPNTSSVINALANSMRGGVAGSTRLRIVLSQQLSRLSDVRRDPSFLIAPHLCRMYAGRGLN